MRRHLGTVATSSLAASCRLFPLQGCLRNQAREKKEGKPRSQGRGGGESDNGCGCSNQQALNGVVQELEKKLEKKAGDEKKKQRRHLCIGGHVMITDTKPCKIIRLASLDSWDVFGDPSCQNYGAWHVPSGAECDSTWLLRARNFPQGFPVQLATQPGMSNL